MSMQSLGGSMPAGQPVTVASGNRAHVFAISKSGTMNHWMSTDGGAWSGPTALPGGNLAPSFPTAIAVADGSVHVFAIANGGELTHWRSVDGIAWSLGIDKRAPIPGPGNGLAAASWGGGRVDVFATTTKGIVQYSFDGATTLSPVPMLKLSGGLNRCVLAAASMGAGTLDVFGVEPNVGGPLRWSFDGKGWTRTMLVGPVLDVTGNAYNVKLNSLAAVATPAAGRIDLLALTNDRRLTRWQVSAAGTPFDQLPASPWPLAAGVPAVVATGAELDVFAVGAGGPLQGGPLVRWTLNGAWGAPVAYESGLAAGGVGAVSGVGGLEAFGFESGTNNPLLHWPAGIETAPRDGWSNWANNRRTDHPEGHCYPTSLEELVAVVKTAARQGKRARAVGSSWSFSDIAQTPGYVVETNQLSKVLTTVLPKAQAAGATSILPPEPFHLVHVEAGIQVEALMNILDATNRAPATMGGSSGQTLAGVISTSLHGGHYKLPPFPDWVRAVHLVGPDGKQYWIEPADRPITDPAKLQAALGPAVTPKYSNEWFDSVIVGVGSLGIIYSVVLEVRDAYKLEETRTRTTWSALRPSLAYPATGTEIGPFAAGEAVQVAIDPGSVATADPVCILSSRRAVPMATTSDVLSTNFDPLAAFCEGDRLLELMFGSAVAVGAGGALAAAIAAALPAIPVVAAVLPAFGPAVVPVLAAATTFAAAAPLLLTILRAAGPGALGDLVGIVLDKLPQLTASVISELTASAQAEGVQVDLAHQVMARRNKGECASRGLALELAFDATNDSHLRFADAALALLKTEAGKGNLLGGWFSLRFVGPSRAILSPQQTARTCMVEFVGLRTLSSTKTLLDALERLGREFGATQHWGMHNDLWAADVTAGYPRLDVWRQTRWELTRGGTVRTFDNAFTSRSGLSAAPSSRAIWSDWAGMGGWISKLATARNADGRIEVFGIGSDNALYHNWQTSPGGDWSGWAGLGGGISELASARNADGRIEVFAIGTDGALNHNWQTSPGGDWSGWAGLGGGITKIATAINADGRLEVFAIGTDGALNHNWQTSPGGGWSGWHGLGGRISALATARNRDGRLEVFGVGSDNALYHNWQTSPGGGDWSGWIRLGGDVSRLATASEADGRLGVFVIGNDQTLYRKCQTSPGGDWSTWDVLGGGMTEIASATNPDGRLELFAIGADKALNHTWQTTPGGAWSDLAGLGGGITQIATAVNADGRLETFAIGTDGALNHIWET